VAAVDRCLAEAVGRPARPELGRRTRRVADTVLRNGDVADPLAVAKRDIAVRPREGSVEDEDDLLLDRKRSVRLDGDVDVGEREVEGLRGSLAGRE